MTMTKSWVLKGLLVLLAIAIPGIAQVHAQTVEYVHTDALGSVVAITDATGNVTERNEYEPYGNDLTGVKDGPGYTGHVSDAATGLTYMQQRYYDGQLGRFLSVDPVDADSNMGGNFNRYKYANNNPYRFVDPDGRSEEAFADLGEVIAVEISKYRYRNTTNVQEKVRLGNHLALVHDLKYGDRSTASQYRAEVQQLQGAPEGIVYRRVNMKTGDTYVGQAKNPARYAARQREHDRELGMEHEYEVLSRAMPGKDLDAAEESQIRLHGGLRKDGGGLVNKRHQMSERRYRSAGGREPPPTGTRIRRR